jgi:hypothetical protein
MLYKQCKTWTSWSARGNDGRKSRYPAVSIRLSFAPLSTPAGNENPTTCHQMETLSLRRAEPPRPAAPLLYPAGPSSVSRMVPWLSARRLACLAVLLQRALASMPPVGENKFCRLHSPAYCSGKTQRW